MSKTFRGVDRNRHKKNWLKFQDKRKKRSILEETETYDKRKERKVEYV